MGKGSSRSKEKEKRQNCLDMENNTEGNKKDSFYLLPKEQITKEKLPQVLVNANEITRLEGTSEILIPYLDSAINRAAEIGEHSFALELTQVKFISAQHMIMEEVSKKLHANSRRILQGRSQMKKSLADMQEQVAEHGDGISILLKSRVSRFEGKFFEISLQFGKAEKAYRKGLEYFKDAESIEERHNRLEFQGFLANSLLMQVWNPRKVGQGFEMAVKTIDEFDDSEEGKWIKEVDYYKWAVWKSGIQIRTAQYIKIFHIKNKQEFAQQLLQDARKILVMPNGSTKEFAQRIAELNQVNK